MKSEQGRSGYVECAEQANGEPGAGAAPSPLDVVKIVLTSKGALFVMWAALLLFVLIKFVLPIIFWILLAGSLVFALLWVLKRESPDGDVNEYMLKSAHAGAV